MATSICMQQASYLVCNITLTGKTNDREKDKTIQSETYFLTGIQGDFS